MNRSDIALFLLLNDKTVADNRRNYYKEFARHFSQLIIIAREEADDTWIRSEAEHTVRFSSKENKVAALNKAVQKAHTSHILLLESDEYCDISELPDSVEEKTCYRVLIETEGDRDRCPNYQVRLFPAVNGTQKLFKGGFFADLSTTFFEQSWSMAETVIPVQKSGPLFDMVDAEPGKTSVPSGLSDFWDALVHSHNNKYRLAEEKFRRALKRDDLFEFDYLASLNGLTNALVEQHKLEAAEKVAYNSLDASRQQRAPYLSLYKIKKLQSCDEEAYHYLNTYLRVCEQPSCANMDVHLPVADCHFLMAEASFKLGNYKRAFRHYEQFYELNGGAVSRQVLEKLFIYAIELEDYGKAVRYFDDLFGSYIPDNLNEDRSARLLESLALFMDNGWYDFVSEVYRELVTHNPEDNKLLNGWITTLIKNKEVDKARELLKARKTG